MNRAIAGDVRFFLAAVLLGAMAALFYDMLRVFRRVRKQSLFFVSVQDFFYWFALGLAGFCLMYRYNAGVLRFFAFLGIVLGGGLYWITFGRFFVKYCVKLMLILTFPIRKGLLFLKKQGKLIKRTWKQVREQKRHGRKDALAKKKRKTKNRSQAASVSSSGDVRSIHL